MLDNNTNKNCGYAESLLAFLYEEIERDELAKFEKHLSTCTGCERELAAFGLVRSSIGIWKQDEFASLETPGFEIPQAVETTRLIATRKTGRFDGILTYFSLSPVRAALAFAAVVLCVGITLIIFSGGGSDLASKPAEQLPAANLENPSETSSVSDETIPVLARETNMEPAETADEQRAVSKRKITARESKTRARIATAANPDNRESPQDDNQQPDKNTVAGQNPNSGDNRLSPVEYLEIPVLSNVPIEEDNSVRLSDLFDEVGSD